MYGQAAYAYSCADGSQGSGFSQCSIAEEVDVTELSQPVQDQKIILGKDPEIVRAVRRLALAAMPVVCDNGA